MAKFWAKVQRGQLEQCWPWMGAKTRGGYGEINSDGSMFRAHRVAYELFYGLIPSHMSVLHRCDNPGCVNPMHLFLGTNQDNMRDCLSKGRWGTRHPGKKLNRKKALLIKKLSLQGLTRDRLAELCGVDEATVRAVLKGRTWKYVQLSGADAELQCDTMDLRAAPGEDL